jgi:hypothetical protein
LFDFTSKEFSTSSDQNLQLSISTFFACISPTTHLTAVHLLPIEYCEFSHLTALPSFPTGCVVDF